mmetsp:Transcript_17633/g.58081  ORF Transcript_17633/g.58081 Transcript_17633/m.58081 type:complete len:437 (-) Transcript_17633:326-1636(-)
MLLHLLGPRARPETLARVAGEEALEKRLYLLLVPGRQHELLAEDVVVDHLAVVVVERMIPRHHLPRQDPQRPPVNLLPVLVLLQLLGRHVQLRACPRLRADGAAAVSVLVHLRATEVRDDEVTSGVDEDVLRLEIAVNDAVSMQLLKRQCHLSRVDLRSFGRERGILMQEIKELTAGKVVHDQVEPSLALESIVHGDDVGMTESAHDTSLGFGASQVVLKNNLLPHALHRVDLPAVMLPHLIDLAEPTLPNHVQDLEVIDRDFVDLLLRAPLGSLRSFVPPLVAPSASQQAVAAAFHLCGGVIAGRPEKLGARSVILAEEPCSGRERLCSHSGRVGEQNLVEVQLRQLYTRVNPHQGELRPVIERWLRKALPERAWAGPGQGAGNVDGRGDSLLLPRLSTRKLGFIFVPDIVLNEFFVLLVRGTGFFRLGQVSDES